MRLTHPDRVLYPDMGITKRDLALYYESIADWVLPYVVDRPLTLVRCPAGRTGQCFYQKHLTETMPQGLRGVMIKEKSGREEYVVVDDLAGLVSLVQMGVLEMHPWPARADKVELPDMLVFDFDPGEGAPWKLVVEGARTVRDLLAELGLTSFLRASGGKGLHVVAPLAAPQFMGRVQSVRQSGGRRDGAARAGAVPGDHEQGEAPRQGVRRLPAEPARGDSRGLVLFAAPVPGRPCAPR